MSNYLQHLAVDLDDVVLDFMPGVLACFEREYGQKLPYNGNPWDIPQLVEHDLLRQSGYDDWWGWLRDREWLWATFPAVPGAIGSLKILREAGYYIECVTVKPLWAEHNVWKWLGKWRPPFHRVTIVPSGESKLKYTDADILIDDRLESCIDFMDAGMQAIFFDRAVPSRKVPVEYAGHLWVAKSWDEVRSLLLFT